MDTRLPADAADHAASGGNELEPAVCADGAPPHRQEVVQALRESEERFRLLSEAAAEGVVIHDDGIILDANRSLARMVGYELEELLGRNIIDMLATPESRELVLAHLRAGSTARLEVTGRRKDGTTIVVEVTGRPTTYRGRQVRVATLYDVTDRKRVEESAHRLAVEEARRVAAE
jgi:PAS domain S-box-containing protein